MADCEWPRIRAGLNPAVDVTSWLPMSTKGKALVRPPGPVPEP